MRRVHYEQAVRSEGAVSGQVSEEEAVLFRFSNTPVPACTRLHTVFTRVFGIVMRSRWESAVDRPLAPSRRAVGTPATPCDTLTTPLCCIRPPVAPFTRVFGIECRGRGPNALHGDEAKLRRVGRRGVDVRGGEHGGTRVEGDAGARVI